MARFPYQPGAGAKAIRNPIYWNRLYLQENRAVIHAKKSDYGTPQQRLSARYSSLHICFHLFMSEWMIALTKCTETISTSEARRLEKALLEFNEYRSEMYGLDADCLSQGDLNKFSTRLKRLILTVLKLNAKYGANSKASLSNAEYDASAKEFVLSYRSGKKQRRYFLGQPDVSNSKKLDELYWESESLYSKCFE